MDTAALEEATHLLAEVIPETEQLDLALALQERGEMSCGVCYPEAFREKTACGAMWPSQLMVPPTFACVRRISWAQS